MLKLQHAFSLSHHGGQHHALIGDLTVAARLVQRVVSAGQGELIGSGHVGGMAHHPLQHPQAVHRLIAHLREHLQHRAGHRPAHVAGMAVAAHHIVKVNGQVIQLARVGADVHMVDVALRAVEEDAAGIVNSFLQRAAEEARPVRGNGASAHGIRMNADAGQNHSRAALPVKADNAHAVVHAADGAVNIRVVHTGIGADGAVLHAEPADEGNTWRAAYGPAHTGGLQVLQGQHGCVPQAGAEKGEVRLLNLRCNPAAQVHLRPGVGVGAVEDHRLRFKPGSLRDLPAQRLRVHLKQAGDVHADQHSPRVPQRKRNGIGFQLVQNAIGQAHLIVAGQGRAQGRGDVHPGKPNGKVVHAFPSPF